MNRASSITWSGHVGKTTSVSASAVEQERFIASDAIGIVAAYAIMSSLTSQADGSIALNFLLRIGSG